MPKAYELPAPGEPFDIELFSLGLPCKRNHIHANGLTLRYCKSHACILCSRIDSGERQKALRRDPHHRMKAAAYMAERRKRQGRPSRANHSTEWHELRSLQRTLRLCGRYPSVAQLVYRQQRERWRHHPEERRNHNSQWSAYYYAFRYKCDPAFRRNECQRNSERKAKNRGNHTVSISSKETASRFAQFDNACAYCGSEFHLIVEHFIPRAKGGPHALGNLLPACHQCNVSKRDHEPQQWYQSQSFFSKARWRKILMTLGKAKSSVLQLPLL